MANTDNCGLRNEGKKQISDNKMTDDIMIGKIINLQV